MEDRRQPLWQIGTACGELIDAGFEICSTHHATNIVDGVR